MSLRYSWKRSLIDLTLSGLAIAGLIASVVAGFSVKTLPNDFSDFKTVYASAWCFAHGFNPYSIPNIQAVFMHQGIAVPAGWFGRYPVYPPTTLALLAPFSVLSMPAAAYAVTILSAAALVIATARLLQHPLQHLELSWGWKAVCVTLCASGPLLAFAVSVGNLSILTTALAILAFSTSRTGRIWPAAIALAVAILLKPHLAIWIALGMLLLQKRPRRAVAVRAILIVVAFVCSLAAVLALQGRLAMQVSGLHAVLRQEASAGSSMSVSSREVLPIEAQITSLQSLFGFWSRNQLITALLALAVLTFAAWWLVRLTRQARTEAESMLAVAAWISFGLLATYHRTHDAIALLLLLPFIIDRLRRDPLELKPWLILGLYLTMSFGPSMDAIRYMVATSPEHSLLQFAMLRQAGIADACLLLALIFVLRSELLHQAHRVQDRAALSERFLGRVPSPLALHSAEFNLRDDSKTVISRPKVGAF